VGGNPAKEIRKRFTEQQILNLKRIAWWNWPVQKIKDQVTLLSSVNIDQFIANHLNDA
jgi:virginiamycin A acetyltransferase